MSDNRYLDLAVASATVWCGDERLTITTSGVVPEPEAERAVDDLRKFLDLVRTSGARVLVTHYRLDAKLPSTEIMLG